MKTVKILSCVFALLLAVSNFKIVSFAMDRNEFILRTVNTVPSDDSQLVSIVFDQSGQDYTNNLIATSNTFDFSTLSDYDYYVCYTVYKGTSNGSHIYWFYVLMFNSLDQPFIVVNSSGTNKKIAIVAPSGTYARQIFASFSSLTSGDFSNSVFETASFYDTNGMSNNYKYTNISYNRLLDTNLPVFAQSQIMEVREATNPTDSDYGFPCSAENRALLTDIFASSQGYNSNGDIVSGDQGIEIESNANHMYFQNVELGFCEPRGITNFSNFGGAYAYVRYSVDDWVVNHINDYDLVIGGQAHIGTGNFSGSVTVPLDYDGCVTVPLSSLYSHESGFFAYITNNKVEGDFYKTFLYSMSTRQIENFLTEKNNYASSWSELLSGNYGNYLAAVFGSNVSGGIIDSVNDLANIAAQQYNPYTITLGVMLKDKDDNQSGRVMKTFNLVDGSSFADDTSGLVNEDPFIPSDDDTSSDDYIPTIPSDNSTSQQVVVYTGGTWSGNMNAKIGYDPGYTELKNDLNVNPDGNFTQYLNPLSSEDGKNWFFSFVDQMPSEIKGILTMGAGVGVLFGIYRFVRRG